jgi:hypothetical protein
MWGQVKKRRRLLSVLALALIAGFLALLFLLPVPLPLGPLDVGGTVRREFPGSTTPQGFSEARNTGLRGGEVGQITFRMGERSIVITWARRGP